MKNSIRLIIFALLFCAFIYEIRAEKLQIGDKFAVEKLSAEGKKVDNTIIAFVPSLTDECEYASMLTQSFYYYFDQKLAFETSNKFPATRIFLIVKDKQNVEKSLQNLFGGMNVIYDESGELFSFFDVKQPANKNADSTVILLDSNEKVAHIDENYRAQGEHLKPLENKLKNLNGIETTVKAAFSPKPLKVGDNAPDFRVDGKNMLSNLRGNVVLISFYPAAFSGVLPRPVKANAFDFNNLSDSERASLMSCTIQIIKLDLAPKVKKEPKRIVISSSTDSLLLMWKEVLGTKNVEYTNDADYSISSSYFSYNLNGYNNRVSVIVDQKGKIAYIDTEFNFGDEAVLNAKMDELLKK